MTGMEPVLTKYAVSIGTSLAKLSMRPASRMILGEPERRAMEKIHQVAVQKVIGNISAAGNFSDTDLDHAASLLELLVRRADSGDFPLLPDNTGNTYEVLGRWRDIAARQGLDPETFPLSFELLVSQLLRVIPEEIASAVTKPDNPLFRSVALAELEDLRSSVSRMARLTPLDGQVQQALNAARRSCSAMNRRLFTPDVLLALLHLPDGSVASCFCAVSADLPDRVGSALQKYIGNNSLRPFVPFKWVERREVQQAQIYAWANAAPVVSATTLLLGVLDAPSNTRDQLAALLRQDFETVRNSAWSHFHDSSQVSTPGIVFSDNTEM
jgi:hypothetical protein